MTDNGLYGRRQFLKLGAVLAAIPALMALKGGIAGSALRGQPADAGAAFKEVASVVHDVMLRARVPGVALGVHHAGRTETAVFGVTDLASQSPVQNSTLFQAGSITKTLTATAVMRLVEEHRLDVDAPVKEYFPDLRLSDWEVEEQVTLRHLFNHSSGWWGDRFAWTGEGEDAIARYVSGELPRLPQIAPLGRFVNYSNSALTLAGRVLEVVTGQTYREAVHRLVLDRVGLCSQAFDPQFVKASHYAHSHSVTATGDLEEPTPELPRHNDPAGGLWSSIDDLIAYGRMHLDGGGVLSRKSIVEMQTPSMSVQGMPGSAFGVSWLISDLSFGRVIEHTGGTPGQSSLLFIVPAASFVLAVLANSNSGGAVVESARQAAKRVYFGSSEETPETGQNLPALNLSPSDLAAFAGTYRTPSDELQLIEENGRLRLSHRRTQLNGQMAFSSDATLPSLPVDIVDNDVGILGGVENGGRPIHFLRRRDGSIGWLSLGLRLMIRQ